MTYRDDAAAQARQEHLATERALALGRIEQLEADLAEARAWWKARQPSAAARIRESVGYGGLGGSFLGVMVWAFGLSAYSIALATFGGAMATAGLAAVRIQRESRRVPHEEPPPD